MRELENPEIPTPQNENPIDRIRLSVSKTNDLTHRRLVDKIINQNIEIKKYKDTINAMEKKMEHIRSQISKHIEVCHKRIKHG
jgi:hypothetical protein